MEPQQPEQQPTAPRHHQHPHLHAIIPPPSAALLHSRTASSTPMSSPGLFSPSNPRPKSNFPAHPASDTTTPALETGSPYLHPLQNHKVRETHKALIDSDSITGRKLINQYEVIEEIGRGMHGKVKLARNLETGENVAIKIIPRYSKKRRLGKVAAMSPQDKTMREIAILKKMRHPNVVSLLEIIDDPELKKIYLILEHVELGEVVWRKKGLPHICLYERRRIEREMRGEPPSSEEEQYDLLVEQRQAIRELKRAKMIQAQADPHDYWSIEHGVADDGSSGSQSRVPSKDNLGILERIGTDGSLPSSLEASRATSRTPSRSQSVRSMGNISGGPAFASDQDMYHSDDFDHGDIETPGALRSNHGSSAALDGTMYGAYIEDAMMRGRSPSMADSIISHMSSIDYNPRIHDPFAEDFSYVPCFTQEQARSTFRDTVLGLEYLHYQGVVHRDIKPANLLWTKDHRVKISDFGVSYFGRPIRDGEPDDETVSESEAQDFDDDLELAKTVGTPAFFAPELCYTDTEFVEQPRISEMIDIWSLGVTLYCLVFARIPFQAEDEWQMFRKIATEDVYIPHRRLRPVDPSTSPSTTSLFKRQNNPPYRDDNELAYEDIDPDLINLLRKMFARHPDKRIRLRDIKRHPWVTKGITNLIGWLDDTDPARPSQGRRVQVNDRETAHAVVPITFLERARSVAKKVVGKVMHPLGERGDSRTRQRALSSAASSAGDSMHNLPATPHPRDARRQSLKSDDYFSSARASGSGSEHPLSQSVVASPAESDSESPYDPLATAIAKPIIHRGGSRFASSAQLDAAQDYPADDEAAAKRRSLGRKPSHRHSQIPSTGNTFLSLTPGLPEAQTMPATPYYDVQMEDAARELRKARDFEPYVVDDLSRSRSVDRGLFASSDKRAPPMVGVSTAIAPGNVQKPGRPRPMRSIDLGKAKNAAPGLASPLFFSSRAITGYQHGQPQSDSNIYENRRQSAEQDERPQTAHRIEYGRDIPEGRTPPPRTYNASTPESFARAKDELQRKQIAEYRQQLATQQDVSGPHGMDMDPAEVPCPPSPDDEPSSPQGPPPLPPSRGDTMETIQSFGSTSMMGITTPLTSPSEVTSPISSTTHPSKERMLVFQSDPSLPALLSGSSSVSNDLEGESLAGPGIVNTRAALLETTDSLTPPALGKEVIATGFPLEHFEEQAAALQGGAIPVRLDSNPNRRSLPAPASKPYLVDDDEDDSDSDDGLVMAKSKKKTAKPIESNNPNATRVMFAARRRDTNASIASTETAKKLVVNGDEAPAHTD